MLVVAAQRVGNSNGVYWRASRLHQESSTLAKLNQLDGAPYVAGRGVPFFFSMYQGVADPYDLDIPGVFHKTLFVRWLQFDPARGE